MHLNAMVKSSMLKEEKFSLLSKQESVTVDVLDKCIYVYITENDRNRALRFSILDIAKIIDILKRNNIRATIYIKNKLFEKYVYSRMGKGVDWDQVKIFDTLFKVNFISVLTLDYV